MTPPGYVEVRFRTKAELAKAIAGKNVYETPEGGGGVVGGIRIFSARDTDEFAVYVQDKQLWRE